MFFLPEFTAAAVLTNFELYIHPLIMNQDVGIHACIVLIPETILLLLFCQMGLTCLSVEEEQGMRH